MLFRSSWARYVYQECLQRFYQFAVQVMGVAPEGEPEAVALKGIEAMEDFYRSIHMPTSFAELGIAPSEAELKELAHKCSIAAGGKKGSAKVMCEEDMLAVFRLAAQR